jgi:hypothetical protein
VSSAREPVAWGGIIEKTGAFVKKRFAVREKEIRKELRLAFVMFYVVWI